MLIRGKLLFRGLLTSKRVIKILSSSGITFIDKRNALKQNTSGCSGTSDFIFIIYKKKGIQITERCPNCSFVITGQKGKSVN